MMVAIPVAVETTLSIAQFAGNAIVKAIGAMYQVASDFDKFLDKHIEELKASDNPLIASTGRVLEAAKFGFGLGYVASTVLIAVGQYLLGNTFAAIATVGSAAILSNPIAMTCGALGAIYFGWKALTDKEREQILDRLSLGLTVGVELIRSLVEFAIRKSRELLNPSQLEGAKKFIKVQAEAFGRSLYDVTHQIGDFVADSAEAISKRAGLAGEAVSGAAVRVGGAVVDGTEVAVDAMKSRAVIVGTSVRDGVSGAGDALKQGVVKLEELAADAARRIKGSHMNSTGPVVTTIPYVDTARSVGAGTTAGVDSNPSSVPEKP
jgi:hypothetical protein